MLLIDLLASYQADRPNLQPASAREIICTIHRFSVYLGHPASLCDLHRDLVIAFCRSIPGAWTANKHRVNLQSLWNHAADLEMIAPPRRIPKRTEPRREPVVWTLEELQLIWATTDLLEGEWSGVPIRLVWKIALAICWDTACRIGTLHKADLCEVNLRTGVWSIPAEHTKGRRRDYVQPLHLMTIKLIKQSMIGPRKKLWPFPFSQTTAIRHLGKLIALAGLQSGPKRKFHCIRRTAESYAAASMGISAAAQAVGHSEAVARKYYISATICKAPSLLDGLPHIF